MKTTPQATNRVRVPKPPPADKGWLRLDGRICALNDGVDPIIAELARRRRSAGMTQRELARRINYSPRAVGLWEMGRKAPSLFAVHAYADAVGADITLVPRDRIVEAS